MSDRLIQKVLLAVACCFVLVLLPISTGWAQEDVLKKGAEEVKEGAETVIDKTEDAGEAVGKGAKDLFTDDDKDTEEEVIIEREKPMPTQSEQGTRTDTSPEATSPYTSAEESDTSERDLPATAGELPLLALAGWAALAGAGALKVVRRRPKAN